MKNYLVIGGSSGIGQQVVEDLSSQDTKIFASFFKNQKESSENIQYFQLDVTKDISFKIESESLDGIVYCPGSINLKSFTRAKSDDFINDYQIQVNGLIKVLQHVLPLLRKSNDSSIVLFSTVAVQTGFPFHSIVSVSKGAIEGLTRALAAEFAPKIRINAIAPSITDTPLASSLLNTEEKKRRSADRHPLKKIGSVKDISNAVLFLLGEKSSWMTGQILSVDGGISNLRV